MGKIMNQNGNNSFDEFIKFFNEYMASFDSETTDENSSSNTSQASNGRCENCMFGNENAEATEDQRKACSDVPGGFQDFNPQILNLITVLFGNIASQKMPFNVQNALGNWLQLLGQVIITFNAQQQYFQGGPGRIYSPIYRNAANPFCSNSSDEGQANVSSSKKKKTTSSSENKVQSSNDINELKKSISELSKQIKELQSEIENLKKK
jgi:hypothetical protein